MDSGDIVYAVKRPTLDNHPTLLQAMRWLLASTQLAQGSLGILKSLLRRLAIPLHRNLLDGQTSQSQAFRFLANLIR